MFQFTHPGRGATEEGLHHVQLSVVSIHAPREGCDCFANSLFMAVSVFQFTHPGRGATPSCIRKSLTSVLFQFTHPGRGATWRVNKDVGGVKFQFTHPGRGATMKNRMFSRLTSVSIHAPREGCDRSLRVSPSRSPSFNSRTPGGVRRHAG